LEAVVGWQGISVVAQMVLAELAGIRSPQAMPEGNQVTFDSPKGNRYRILRPPEKDATDVDEKPPT
jgi:hypothetical protein